MGHWHLSPARSLLELPHSEGISPYTHNGRLWGRCRCNHTRNHHAKFLPWHRELHCKYSNLDEKTENYTEILLSQNFISSHLTNIGVFISGDLTNIKIVSNTISGKLLEKSGAHMGFPEHTDIILN